MESLAANSANMVRNRSAVLNVKEKVHLKQVRNLLIFESGACVTARKYSNIINIHMQVICVSEQKCQNVDIASSSPK
jgi:K+-transporting ATPase A subunit